MTDDYTSQSSADPGSFLTGFTLGLFAGAAGYFLFGTNRGQKVRAELAQEWESAKEYLAEQGVVENAQVSLREVIKDTVEEVVRRAGIAREAATKETRKTKNPKSTHTKEKTEKSTHKFKGV